MITIKELARLCECSVATVNRALNDKPDVNKATKLRVKKLAEELGYRPHLMARSLATGRTNIIGLIVLDIQNPFFGQLINILNKDLLLKGYSLHLGIMDGTPASEYHALEQMAGMKVDGIIHFPMNIGSKYKQFLNRLHIPLVHLCNFLDDDFPFVGVEEKLATIEAVETIKAKGYEKLIYVSPPLRYRGSRNLYTIEERLKGVEESSSGLETEYVTEKEFIQATYKILKNQSKKTCVLCSNDIFALDIMTNFRNNGLNSPANYGLMGFDNISFLRHITPRLSTIAYPVESLAMKSMEVLLDLIEEKPSRRIMMKAHLIDGETI
jgi:DNA-binding LacI/PurR family transcriptional regulator